MDYECYTGVSTTDPYGCMEACSGLYADVEFTGDVIVKETETDIKFKKLQTIMTKRKYNNQYVC